MSIVKTLLSGEGDSEPNRDAVAQVANEVYAQDLLSSMVVHLGKFDFEVCRSSIAIALSFNQGPCCWVFPYRTHYFFHMDITPAICVLTGPQARKDVCNIYSILLRRQLGSRSPTVDTIATRPDIIFNTLKGCV